jgi:hypothetical protein
MPNDGFGPTRPDGTNHGVSRNSATTPGRVRTQLETMQQAAQLRAAGLSFREIGQALSIDHTWARTLVLKALEAVTYEAADLMRVQEGQRLDQLQRAVWAQAIQGDYRAIAAALKIMERRARLFGLDAPIQVEVSDEIDRQIEQLAAQIIPGQVIRD